MFETSDSVDAEPGLPGRGVGSPVAVGLVPRSIVPRSHGQANCNPGVLGHLAYWGIWRTGASGALGHLAHWGIWRLGGGANST